MSLPERIQQELVLLRRRHPDLEYREDGRWVRIPGYTLLDGWNRTATDVAFQIRTDYPGTPPYGIYVPGGLLFKGERPDNYTEPASSQPPFGGTWGIFSWTQIDSQWRPTADLVTGSNLANWVSGFADRFREGK
jgi:hypothetical protein